MLSQRLKDRVKVAITNSEDADELIAAIENETAASVAPLGTTSALVGVDGVGDNAAPLAGTEARLDAIEAKIDELIAALAE